VLSGAQIDSRLTSVLSIPVFLIVYGVSGYCEQIGWTAFATDRLLKRYSIIASGLLLGLIWAGWHIIPFLQAHHSVEWVVWQCVFSVILRVLMTKVYVLTKRSVVAPILLHVTYNTAFSLMPYYGSSYDPMYMAFATLIVTLCIFVFVRGD